MSAFQSLLTQKGEPVTGDRKGQEFQVSALPENILSRVPNAPKENMMNQMRNKGGLNQVPEN